MAKPLLTDIDISELLADLKIVTNNDYSRLLRRGKPKANQAFLETQIELTSEGKRRYRIICLRHERNALQFSLQVLYVDADGNEYRLIRVAGRPNTPHTNELEREQGAPGRNVPRGFRINRLTERYQLSAYEEDGFAESANGRCSDLDTAIQLLGTEAGIEWPVQTPRLL